ncbi:MAG: exported protein of unknown function [Candidatus Saccharibacteria bacterium]|nr:exported protein of unknown function [Candidatus Saccharibacteria bacterium]
MRAWKQTSKLLLTVLLVFAMPASAAGDTSSSTNYQVTETFFGSGGELQACSSQYCSKQSAGELSVGNTSSGNYQAQAGFNTNREPYIEFTVDTSSIDLGEIRPGVTKTATATFSIKTYLANGYTVTTVSDPPTNGAHALTPIAVPSASSAGTEQFGINLAANTAPATFGAVPAQDADPTFSFGIATTDYSTANLYKYHKGDVIAQSNQSTSYTHYTISYLFNISNVTPGGAYSMNHDLVATSTF